MVFNENSLLVQFWVKQVQINGRPKEDIPLIYNLYDEVNKIISGE